MKKILEVMINELIESASEKRWVFGRMDKKWRLVGKDNRDWEYGITPKEMKKLDKTKAEKKYLSAWRKGGIVHIGEEIIEKLFEVINELIESTSEKRWVYGTKDKKWHLVGKDDRDWKKGITSKEMKKLGKEKSKEKYLSARMV